VTQSSRCLSLFSLTAPATTDIYTLSLHDALPIFDGPVDRAVVTLSYNNEFVQAIGAGDRVVGVDRGTVQRAPYLGFTEEDIVGEDRKSTRLNSSHVKISYAVFCLKKKKKRKEKNE